MERLADVTVEGVYCGGHFSVALARGGKVYSWGKGEGWRLGHATEEHVRFPQVVEALQGT